MPMLQSPRTQAMSPLNTGSTGDDAKNLFDQGLSQMAYNVLINKLPNVAPDVVTFKVLDTEPEHGSGVGAFVISRHGQLLYVPVVMADNQIKPLDILYYKDLNTFLPLTKEWLEALDKLSLGEMGQGTVTPQTVQSDVDIRNIVVPPTTGRYSYAEDAAGRVFDEARVQVDPQHQFLHFLDNAPNRVKEAAAKLFETHPRLLKTAVWHYGVEGLTKALQLRQEKIATGGTLSRSGGLFIADKTTKPAVFKEIWGEQSGVAFQGVAVKSYYAKDDRKNLKRPVRMQNRLRLTEPKDPGAYRLWKRDGSEVLALVVNGAQDFFRNSLVGGHSWPGNESWHKPRTTKHYTGVTEDGKVIDAHELLGEPITAGELEGSKIYKKVFGESKSGPKIGQWGIFVRAVNSGGFAATHPVFIKSIATIDDVKRVEVADNSYERCQTRTLVFDGGNRNMNGKNSKIFHLSRDFTWLPVSDASWDQRLRDSDFIKDPHDVYEYTAKGLEKNGGEHFVVKKSSQHGFLLEGHAGANRSSMREFSTALDMIARHTHIPVDDAADLLKIAEDTGRCDFWAITDAGLEKFAAESEGGSSKPKSKPKQGDPAEAAMDEVMAAQMAAPQGPSPVDMAVAEQSQNIQGQIVALQGQLQLLQNVQNRANMIGGAGGAAGAPAAAAAAMGGPLPPEMMGAGQPPLPQQPGMGQPSMGGGQPQQPGMPQGGQPQQQAPGMAGQQMPPMAPGMQPGMDPSQQGQQQGQQPQQPMAAMTADDGSMDSILQQVNPQFMDSAAQLNDAGAFDASALASMAQTPQLKDMVSAYIPNLEKSLDNLGRVLLTLWMDEREIKEDLGDETYIELEENLRTVFKGLGQLILKVNQNTAVLRAGLSPHGK